MDIVPENEAKHISEIHGHATGWYRQAGWEETNQGEHLDKHIEYKKQTTAIYLTQLIKK